MPFDGPKRVLRQAHSLLEDRIVTADAELDLLFRQIVSVQGVIERTYGEIRIFPIGQVAAIVNSSLDIVVAVVSVLALHESRFGVRGQDLRLASLFQLVKIAFVGDFAISQLGFADLLFIWLGLVKLIHLLQKTGDVFLNPHQLLDQGLLLIGTGLAVDRTKLRTIDRN